MEDLAELAINDAWEALRTYHVDGMIASIDSANGMKLKFAPKKKFWFLEPTTIKGSSRDDAVAKLKTAIADGSFWSLNKDAVAGLIMEELPKQDGWINTADPELLKAGFGEMGECLCNILGEEEDAFIMDETRGMIKRHLSFAGWGGTSNRQENGAVMACLYDMVLEISIKKELKILHFGKSEGRKAICARMESDFAEAMCLLKEEDLMPSHVSFVWSDDGMLSRVELSYPDGTKYFAEPSEDDIETIMTDLADAVISQEPEYRQQKEDSMAVVEAAEQERIMTAVQNSRIYGSLSASFIIKMIHMSSIGNCSMDQIQKEAEKHFGFIDEKDVVNTVIEAEDEGILSSFLEDDRARYEIKDERLAMEFIDPKPVNYEQDMDYGQFTDIDWVGFMTDHVGAEMPRTEWVDILKVLDHPFISADYSGLLRDFFESAPDSIWSYIRIKSELEQDMAKKQMLDVLMDTEK